MQWKWYKNGSSSLDKTSQVFDFESRTKAINMKFIALFFVLVAVIATQAAPSDEAGQPREVGSAAEKHTYQPISGSYMDLSKANLPSYLGAIVSQ